MPPIMQRLLACACAALLLPRGTGAVKPLRADDLVESMGVATHLDYGWSEYKDFAMIKQRLSELGIRYIRDGIRAEVADKLNELHRDLGIRMVAVLGNEPDASVTNAKRVLDMVAFIEGDNEPDLDGGDWDVDARAAQRKLYTNIKSDAATRHIPVTSPALCNPMTWVGDENAVKLGDISAWCDYGAMHTYPRRGDPTYVHKDHGEYTMTLPEEMAYCRSTMFGADAPIIVTETGYHDYAGYQTHNKGIPPDVEAKYLPRLFLYYLDCGVTLTCTYEFIDHLPGWYNPDSPSREYELHFGLVYGWPQYNRAMQNPPPVGTPKPVFYALKNLIALFADPGEFHETQPLEFTIENASDSLRHMLFQKRDGTYLLVLWREVECYDTMNDTMLPVASETVRVRLDAATGPVTVFRPVRSPDADEVIGDLSQREIEVTDEVMVLSFQATPATRLVRERPLAVADGAGRPVAEVHLCGSRALNLRNLLLYRPDGRRLGIVRGHAAGLGVHAPGERGR